MMLKGVKNNQFRTLVEILFLRLSRRFYVSMSHRCLCQCCQRLLFGTPTTSLMDEVGVDAKQSKNIGQIYVCIYIYLSIYPPNTKWGYAWKPPQQTAVGSLPVFYSLLFHDDFLIPLKGQNQLTARPDVSLKKVWMNWLRWKRHWILMYMRDVWGYERICMIYSKGLEWSPPSIRISDLKTVWNCHFIQSFGWTSHQSDVCDWWEAPVQKTLSLMTSWPRRGKMLRGQQSKNMLLQRMGALFRIRYCLFCVSMCNFRMR